ncbi:THAP domain-containing protein 4 [Bagarius yarrelli]|uniref:THAP domain-containing protein 4 n=1 Tax=Bagarius yarrelli TaxID=175774 RepID=A0A556V0C0_BAGYA|nr:THAP domain-containing protein 4 [Bagarius yarrelli]
MNPVLLPLDWLLGTWESDEPGHVSFPTIKPSLYHETLYFTHVGQPVINFMFNACHAESKKPLHREMGFIRIQPDTNHVAFIIAQNSGQDPQRSFIHLAFNCFSPSSISAAKHLLLQSKALARMSFAKQPFVQQISRVLQLRSDGRLEQTVFMALENQTLTQHLHITYRRTSEPLKSTQ